MKRISSSTRFFPFVIALSMLLIQGTTNTYAQDRPSQRQLRTYIPPDQLVSFLPSTPFATFIDYLNPIFERVTGRQIIDPLSVDDPIDIAIAGMHFFDAFELVLDYHSLVYRETERYYLIEEPPMGQPGVLTAEEAVAPSGAAASARSDVAAGVSALTREIQINAVLFEMNITKVRDLGIDWNVFFGGQRGGNQSGGVGGGGTGSDQQTEDVNFAVKTDKLFDSFSDILKAPETIKLSTLTQFFRYLENEGAGETIANPSVTVQSGVKGNIQIGSDVPIQVRDFSGNTITQFYQTGIIIDVTPTLIKSALVDTVGAAELEFIHLDVKVEKSSGQPSFAGLVIDRNTADTQVLLLDGEQTIIGGLYSTAETVTRRGMPILKDLPGWVFGLRYIFGYSQTTVSQKELMIVLQAKLVDPLHVRAGRAYEENLLERRRQDVLENLGRVSETLPDRVGVTKTGGQ